MKIFFIALTSIAISVAAQFCLKAGISTESVRLMLTQPISVRMFASVLFNSYIFSGFLLYGLGAVIWLSVLAKWDVSKAYPLVGVGFVFTLLIGYILGETVSLTRICGALLIGVGVYLVATS